MDSHSQHQLHSLRLLGQTAQFFRAQGQQAYLVGGSLRNVLMGEPPTDWDIVTTGDTRKAARALADTLGGHYARMNEKADRVVVPLSDAEEGEQREVVIDVARMKGGTIEEDVRQRDFTVNAMAALLDQILPDLLQAGARVASEMGLIDPSGGLIDVEAKRLRVVDERVFRQDPLRLLRAVRLMTRYQLSIDDRTAGLIVRDAALLPTVAKERIHDELYALLNGVGAMERLRALDIYGLLTTVIPELAAARDMPQPQPHCWDVFEHSLQAVGKMEFVTACMRSDNPTGIAGQPQLAELRRLIGEAEEQGSFAQETLMKPAMKLAALLHDIGKPPTFARDEHGAIHFYQHAQVGKRMALEITRRLGMNTNDQRLVQHVVEHHMRPLLLSKEQTVTTRAIRRYFVDLGSTGIAVALFTLADHLATVGPQLPGSKDNHNALDAEHELTGTIKVWNHHLDVTLLLLEAYIRNRDKILPHRLVSAEELMQHFKLEPGPLVGKLLEEVSEAQAGGNVTSKEEVLRLVEQRLRED